jgi:hypothetical protein
MLSSSSSQLPSQHPLQGQFCTLIVIIGNKTPNTVLSRASCDTFNNSMPQFPSQYTVQSQFCKYHVTPYHHHYSTFCQANYTVENNKYLISVLISKFRNLYFVADLLILTSGPSTFSTVHSCLSKCSIFSVK